MVVLFNVLELEIISDVLYLVYLTVNETRNPRERSRNRGFG